MFILQNENQIAKAINKARKVKPLVRVLEFGRYAVKGSNGDFYTVKMNRNPLGQKEVACECQGAAKGLVCYHAAASLGIHIVLAEQQKQTA